MDDCCSAPKQDASRHSLIVSRWLLVGLLSTVIVPLRAAEISAPQGPKNLHIEAGEASLTLNEFSRQTDIQVLFDFNRLRRLRTPAVDGSYAPTEGLKQLLQGTGLTFDWVNNRTLAITPTPTPGERLGRWWSKFKSRLHSKSGSGESAEVVISTAVENGEPPPAGARELQLDRRDIERSGMVTVPDFLRTRPELFGGGANEGIVLGAEQASNTALGVGANFRGLGAGATVALVNGRPIAPSGNTAAFADVSNLPLSAVDHIDMIPEGGTTLYGGEAAGGVINFVLKDHFNGAQSQAHTGFASGRTLGEQQFDQLWGTRFGDASTLVSLEYYRRDALAASDRAQATSDLTAFGGSNFDTPFGNPPTLFVGSQTWAVPRNMDGRGLLASDLTPGTALHDLNEGSNILPSQRRVNLYSHSTLPLTDHTHAFADVLLGNRQLSNNYSGATAALIIPTTNPYYLNPTGDDAQPVEALYGFLSDLGAMRLSGTVRTGNVAVGFTGLSGGWNTLGEVGYAFEAQNTRIDNLVGAAALNSALADSDPATALNPFGQTNPSTLAQLRTSARYTFDSTFWFARATADRALLSMPGGNVRLLVGSELRREKLEKTSAVSGTLAAETQYRRVWSGFGELRLPLLGPNNAWPGVESLELSLAERLARYSDEGGISTPSFTALWSPAQSLRIRATDAWIFKPPNLGDLSETNTGSELVSVTDSHSITGQSLALAAFGGNHDLRPERGRSWSVGVDFTPAAIPGLTLALTHYDIYLDGRINSISLADDVLGDPRFAPFVNRDPTLQERSSVCHRGAFYGDPASCMTAPIAAIVDARLLNSFRVRTRGNDIAAKYATSTAIGDFEWGLNATYISEFAEALSSASPLVDIVNTEHNPLSLRARAAFGYRFQRFDAAAFVNYTGHYRDTASVPERSVAAWTTVDAQISYDLDTLTQSVASDLRLSASVRNLLGTAPPFLNNQVGLGWDQENAQPLGRVVGVTIRKGW